MISGKHGSGSRRKVCPERALSRARSLDPSSISTVPSIIRYELYVTRVPVCRWFRSAQFFTWLLTGARYRAAPLPWHIDAPGLTFREPVYHMDSVSGGDSSPQPFGTTILKPDSSARVGLTPGAPYGWPGEERCILISLVFRACLHAPMVTCREPSAGRASVPSR